jgi:hypothetical protein
MKLYAIAYCCNYAALAWLRLNSRSWAKHHRVHDSPGQKREGPGYYQSSEEERDHGVTMPVGVAARMGDADRDHDQSQDRQQVDRKRYEASTVIVLAVSSEWGG